MTKNIKHNNADLIIIATLASILVISLMLLCSVLLDADLKILESDIKISELLFNLTINQT